MNTGELQALAQVFGKYPDIQAVYLFGSHAAGNVHAESDVDLAVAPRSGVSRQHRLDLLADLARCGFCRVDLVFLDTTDIVLKYEAVRLNQLVYQAPDFSAGAFYSKIVRQYLDFVPYLQTQRQAYQRRILNGQG